MRLTYEADSVRMPLRSELKKKHEQIKALRDRGMTNVSLLRVGYRILTGLLTSSRRRFNVRSTIANASTRMQQGTRLSSKSLSSSHPVIWHYVGTTSKTPSTFVNRSLRLAWIHQPGVRSMKSDRTSQMQKQRRKPRPRKKRGSGEPHSRLMPPHC